MKLASFRHRGRDTYGLVVDGGVIDVGQRLAARLPTLKAALARAALDEIRALGAKVKPDYALGDIEFLPPVPDPGKILCVGLNYREHLAETGRKPVHYPTLFVRFSDTHVGHDQPLIKPKITDQFDFEGELAVVIARPARAIPVEAAWSFVAGYACYNDGTMRDWQRHSSQFTPGKNFLASAGFGPWLRTADDVPDPHNLSLATRLNGRIMQEANTRDMVFDVPSLIHYISTWTELRPGDVISTGTPGGVGFVRKPPVFLKDGDVVEVEISGVGVLRNPVREL
jgi:2-keto-4-pentenoate hydratase/2-oxohepta-3-ene-1,7-dioic acid hydratase in catechol pathway